MMKKILMVWGCLFLLISTAWAQPGQPANTSEKIRVLPIYINHAQTTFDKDLDQKMEGIITEALMKKYQLISLEECRAGFAAKGLEDLSKAEKADIVEVCRDKADYVIIARIEPVMNEKDEGMLTKSMVSKGRLSVRVVDLKSNTYRINDTLTYKDKDSQLSVSVLALFDIGKKKITLKNFDKIIREAAEKIISSLPPASASDGQTK